MPASRRRAVLVRWRWPPIAVRLTATAKPTSGRTTASTASWPEGVGHVLDLSRQPLTLVGVEHWREGQLH